MNLAGTSYTTNFYDTATRPWPGSYYFSSNTWVAPVAVAPGAAARIALAGVRPRPELPGAPLLRPHCHLLTLAPRRASCWRPGRPTGWARRAGRRPLRGRS